MSRLSAALILALGLPLPAAGEEPLSAIDWLSETVAEPVVASDARPNEPPVVAFDGGGPITVTAIDAPRLDALGLLPVSTTGLPRDLWGTTPPGDVAALIGGAGGGDAMPAVNALVVTILLAELDPPAERGDGQSLYLARIDRLLDLGSLDAALALLELPDRPEPAPFRRWFDVALLLGAEENACAAMRRNPEIAPTFPARIFCLARDGDWEAAALSLRTAEVLGHVDGETADLLTRFLDPGLFDDASDVARPERISPLVFRLLEAVGHPVPTGDLPLAFAHTDLHATSGWKTRIEAAERLARIGAIDPTILMGLYTEQKRAASGSVWERVDAVQRLEAALAAGDRNALAVALPRAWAEMAAAELEPALAAIHGEALAGLGLDGQAGSIAFRLGLLASGYERVARSYAPQDGTEAFLVGLAMGDVAGSTAPDGLAEAVKRAFAPGAVPGPELSALLAERRIGEAVLRATGLITSGAAGQHSDVTRGLALLRAVGLETTARRTALELLILERRG